MAHEHFSMRALVRLPWVLVNPPYEAESVFSRTVSPENRCDTR